MQPRMNIAETMPEAYKALLHFNNTLNKSSLTIIEKQLIKVRASQINSCAYCMDMHTKEAILAGETQQRLFVLSGWRETGLFTDREKALLAITEEVTLIHKKGLAEETYKQAQNFFSIEEISQIIIAVVIINAWNRIAVSSHTQIPG